MLHFIVLLVSTVRRTFAENHVVPDYSINDASACLLMRRKFATVGILLKKVSFIVIVIHAHIMCNSKTSS